MLLVLSVLLCESVN